MNAFVEILLQGVINGFSTAIGTVIAVKYVIEKEHFSFIKKKILSVREIIKK